MKSPSPPPGTRVVELACGGLHTAARLSDGSLMTWGLGKNGRLGNGDERDRLSPRFAELIYNGFWYAPEMDFLRAAITASQENVTGEARVRLYKGSVQVTGRRSPVSLYNESLASFEEDGGYDQADATGFIRLQGLRLARPK